MNKNKEALDELMNGIKYLIDNSKDNGTLVLNGIIQSANVNKTYKVKINGISYDNISAMFVPLSVGTVVKVVVPQGNFNQMVIIGKMNTSIQGGGGGGAVDSVNGKTGVVVLTNDDVNAPTKAQLIQEIQDRESGDTYLQTQINGIKMQIESVSITYSTSGTQSILSTIDNFSSDNNIGSIFPVEVLE
jgi:hypothetical protein